MNSRNSFLFVSTLRPFARIVSSFANPSLNYSLSRVYAVNNTLQIQLSHSLEGLPEPQKNKEKTPEKNKEKEKERLLKEKQKEKLSREKEKEKEKLSKQKEKEKLSKEKEKEKLSVQKEREREKIKREREKKKEKEAELKAKAQRERSKESRARQLEKEKEKKKLLKEKADSIKALKASKPKVPLLYANYVKTQFPIEKQKNPNLSSPLIMKQISSNWKNVSEEEKQRLKEEHAPLVNQYLLDIQKFKEQLPKKTVGRYAQFVRDNFKTVAAKFPNQRAPIIIKEISKIWQARSTADQG